MNVQTRKQERPLNERLLEAFTKYKNVEGFLLECGDTQENRELFEQLSLLESFHEDQRFTFDNGSYIPGLGSRAKGRLSLNTLAMHSKDAYEFINEVEQEICSRLDYKLNETDKDALRESYEVWRESQIINEQA